MLSGAMSPLYLIPDTYSFVRRKGMEYVTADRKNSGI